MILFVLLTLFLIWAIASTVLAIKLWFLYFDLLAFHDQFLSRLNGVIEETNKFMQIPLFEFSEEVVSWVSLVRGFREMCMRGLNGFIEFEADEDIELTDEEINELKRLKAQKMSSGFMETASELLKTTKDVTGE